MFDFFKRPFKNGNSLMQLIYINVGFSLLVWILAIVLKRFVNIEVFAKEFLYLPSTWIGLGHRFWTLITYMFMHWNFWHIFFNMLLLFWFGQIFLQNFSKKQLVGLYLLGGIAGGLFYILFYSVLAPYLNEIHRLFNTGFNEEIFQITNNTAVLCGASASVMAIIIAAAFASPNMPVRFLFIGEIKLKYIAIVLVLFSVFGVTGDNAGGEIAHIGGAVMGWLWFILLKKNVDISRPFDKIITFFVDIFDLDRKKPKKKKPKMKFHYVKSDAEYNQERARNNAEMDKILDKIRLDGYASLTESEKKRLFDISEKL